MKCISCGNNMIELFTSWACDHCNSNTIVAMTSYFKTFHAKISMEEFSLWKMYQFAGVTAPLAEPGTYVSAQDYVIIEVEAKASHSYIHDKGYLIVYSRSYSVPDLVHPYWTGVVIP